MDTQFGINEFFKNLSKAFRLVWAASPRWTVASVVIQVCLGLLPLLSLYLFKLIIDTVTERFSSNRGGENLTEIILLICLAGLVVYVTSMLSNLTKVVSNTLGNIVTDYMHQVIHEKSIEVDLAYFENPQYHDQLHRMQEEAPFLPTQILEALLQFIQNAISLTAISGWLFLYHWAIVPILILFALPRVLVRLYFAKKEHAWEISRTPQERQAWYFHELLTSDSTAKEIKLFSLGRMFANRFQQIKKQLRQEELALDRRWLYSSAGAEALSVLSVFGLYCFIAYRTMLGVLTLGDFVVYYQAIQRGFGFLQTLLDSVTDLYEHNLFVTNVYEFLSVKPRLIDPVVPKPLPHPLQQGIVFEHVSFQYPGCDRKILEDISLHIRPGEHIALVGENGAGKTSLVKLLCRLYDPTNGKIMLDGIGLNEFSTSDIRREVSAMFQDYVQYHLSAKENILLGNTDSFPDRHRIEDAVEQAGARRIIKKLKNGYDTILGRRFEGGEELSIGEWQKIALARAFLRNSQILVLDEPTSAMDAKAEYELFEKYHELAKGRIAILISHRLSTVKMVDRIYFLEQGKIVESGTHDELIKKNRYYAALFERQAKKYR